uniref:tRNA-intron lyase n=1 Tax=Ignisphaera aggregans TaxID=334771 RepID=A0A7C2VPI9_9CREN
MAIRNEGPLAHVKVVGRRAIILNANEGNALFKLFYGKPLAVSKPRIDQEYKEPLVLSLYEALYLCKKGLITVELGGSTVDCEELKRYCENISHEFSVKYRVYEHLRDRNYIIRGGIKYGTDFSVYTLGPGYEHAPYVVTIVPKSHKISPSEIVALGRVSHSVRKRSVLAIVDEHKNDVHYIVFKWVKL